MNAKQMPVYTIGAGTSCFYIYRDGTHFIKSCGDSTTDEAAVKEVVSQLNERALLLEVERIAEKTVKTLRDNYISDYYLSQSLTALKSFRERQVAK